MTDIQKELSFWEHLEELRWSIIKILLAVLLGGIISYIFSDEILGFLTQPSKDLSIDLNLQVLKVTSMFMVKVGIAVMGGISLGIPIIIYQTWKFISPAFEQDYSWSIILIVFFATLLFFVGLAFGYYIIIPFSLGFFTSLTSATVSVNYNFTLDGYLSYIMWLMFACGLVFQLPMLTIFFTRIGFLTPKALRSYRKYAFVFFLILAAILTPPDPLSQILIVIPLFLLYEVSIIISKFFVKKMNRPKQS
ncbi:MAG: twin-arginine translocase subunit TatC [Candidatus Marinimicrobia bacterium]|nr:twin-arginine translocase subunit TatC [Candidatus Neomarinimicrobiota bacterium]MBL7110276.1 twin-arginine translocase subunit TatC [Candidatus Neomarinimicrobiota bacterium]